MKIRMKTLMAGPTVVRHPGEVCVVAPDEAEMLVAAGYAEVVEPDEIRAEEPAKESETDKTIRKSGRLTK